MMSPRDSEHVLDLLPAYLNGSLADDEHHEVRLHLEHCASCREEMEEWRAIASASNPANATFPEPPETVLQAVRARIDQNSASAREVVGVRTSFGAGYLWQLLVGRIPLVRRGIWAAAPATIAIGCFVASLAASGEGSGTVIALVAPALAAVSMSLIYGEDNDPSLELAMSTATSPRIVLLARMTLVFGYDLLLALAGTAVVAVTTGELGLWPLVDLWIGPMLFLSAFALATSLILGTTTAITGALVIWAARVFALTSENVNAGQSSEIAEMINAFWEAGPILVVLFALITVITLIALPKQERFA